jgi:hypothetical protein
MANRTGFTANILPSVEWCLKRILHSLLHFFAVEFALMHLQSSWNSIDVGPHCYIKPFSTIGNFSHPIIVSYIFSTWRVNSIVDILVELQQGEVDWGKGCVLIGGGCMYELRGMTSPHPCITRTVGTAGVMCEKVPPVVCMLWNWVIFTATIHYGVNHSEKGIKVDTMYQIYNTSGAQQFFLSLYIESKHL